VHQEDFCQALGLVPAVKYEKEGGPGVADCADLIRRHCSAPARDITAFLDALLFNFVIANYDAHSKNYSLLLDGPGSIRLAPLYDLLSTAVFQGTDRKLAMKYGGENRPSYVRGRHLDRMAADLDVKPSLVRRRAGLMAERVQASVEAARASLPTPFQDRPMIDRIIEMVGVRAEELTERAGESGTSTTSVEDALREESSTDDFPIDIGDGFDGFTVDLERANELLGEAGDGFRGTAESGELEDVARRMRVHGREMYDLVVDLDRVVTETLDEVEGRAAVDDHRKLLESLARLGTVAQRGSDLTELVYEGLENMERGDSVMRAPLRNMRAGLRDGLDARRIASDWGARAAALLTAGS
jgi:hypothetical protein